MSISMSDVFDYWKDKCITKDGEVKIDLGYEGCNENEIDVSTSIPVIKDWGEPHCFACGIYCKLEFIHNYDELIQSDEDNSLKKIWNDRYVSRMFEKAHIIPKSLGGTYDADNIFCLCKNCHKDSPDTIYPKRFFKFVYDRRKEGNWYERITKKIVDQMNREDIPVAFIDYEKIKQDIIPGVTNTHGATVSDSTVISAVVESSKQKYNNYLDKLTFHNQKRAILLYNM